MDLGSVWQNGVFSQVGRKVVGNVERVVNSHCHFRVVTFCISNAISGGCCKTMGVQAGFGEVRRAIWTCFTPVLGL